MEKEKYEKNKVEIYKTLSSLILKEKPKKDIIRLVLNKAKEILQSEGDVFLDDFLQIISKKRSALEKNIEKEEISSVLKEVIKEKKGLIKNDPFPLILSPIKEKDRIEGIIYLLRRNKTLPFEESELKLLDIISSSISILLNEYKSKDEKIILIKKAFNEKLSQREEKIEKISSKYIGISPSSEKIKEFILKASESDSEVLLQGETGVGKTLVAQLIHSLSKRSQERFLPLNCGTFQETLFESELFGYERYSFTDAKEMKIGLMEHSHRGTLFLDEIEELSPKNQVKLLNALEEKKFRRLGGLKHIESDFRLISSSNKDLKEEIKEKKFREDLFFRINILSLQIPPLRERKEDILPLLEHFLQKEREEKKRDYFLTKEAKNILINHPFPGNIRELKNIIKRAVFFAEKEKIHEEIIKKSISEPQITKKKIKISIDEVKKTLRRLNGNKTKAAEALGISRRYLYKILEKEKM